SRRERGRRDAAWIDLLLVQKIEPDWPLALIRVAQAYGGETLVPWRPRVKGDGRGSFEPPPRLVSGPLPAPPLQELLDPPPSDPSGEIATLGWRQCIERFSRHRRDGGGTPLEHQPIQLRGAHLREEFDRDPSPIPLPAELGDEGRIGFAWGHDGSFQG